MFITDQEGLFWELEDYHNQVPSRVPKYRGFQAVSLYHKMTPPEMLGVSISGGGSFKICMP